MYTRSLTQSHLTHLTHLMNTSSMIHSRSWLNRLDMALT